MTDVFTFAWIWLPLPRGNGLIYRSFCRLWGEAYFAGEVRSVRDWVGQP